MALSKLINFPEIRDAIMESDEAKRRGVKTWKLHL